MRRRAYTLLEMLTTVAALVIVLGLMVSLSRYVRGRSAGAMTRRVMVQLEAALAEYQRQNQGQYPPVSPFIADARVLPDEMALQRAALANNLTLAVVLRRPTGGELGGGGPIRDAWGTPIVFMPPGAINIRTVPQRRHFFLSAGPDRKFLTREDNVYSYEQIVSEQPSP